MEESAAALQELNTMTVSVKENTENSVNKAQQGLELANSIENESVEIHKQTIKSKEIIENINKCKKNLDGQDINTILKQFPVRKRIFIKCALAKFVFPLKLYVALQQKMIGE